MTRTRLERRLWAISQQDCEDGGGDKSAFFLCHIIPLVYEVTTTTMRYEDNTTTALLSIVSLLVSIENGLAQLSRVGALSEQTGDFRQRLDRG